MRFIHAWSYSCASYLTNQLNENHEKRRVYYYGFQVVIGAIVKGVALIASAALLGSLIPAVVIMLVFATLRVHAGGYHMDTYGKCIATSLVLFLASSVFIRYTYMHWDIKLIIAFAAFSFISSLFIIMRWAPADTPNRPITKPEEIKKFKARSIVYMFVWLIANAVLIYYDIRMIALATCFGVILETFLITPAGYKFFDMVKGRINESKK